jgi:hypothetical protein
VGNQWSGLGHLGGKPNHRFFRITELLARFQTCAETQKTGVFKGRFPSVINFHDKPSAPRMPMLVTVHPGYASR